MLWLFNCPVVFNSLQPHGLQHSQDFLSLTISQSLPKFMSIALVMPSSHLILWYPLLPSIFPSSRDFSSSESAVHQMTKILDLQLQPQPSNEYSCLISLKIDWFDLLIGQGTFKSLLQHHSSKASIVWHFDFFTAQLSQSYTTTGKTITLTIWIFVGRVMSLLFNTLSGFDIAFLPRSNRLLMSWLQSPSTVISEPKKKKPVTTSTFSPSIYHEVMGLDVMILVLILGFKHRIPIKND